MIGNFSHASGEKLVMHGIQSEDLSGIRAHVGVESGNVYVFSVRKAMDLIKASNFIEKPVYSRFDGKRELTAIGYIVPINILKPRTVDAKSLIEDAQFSGKSNYKQSGEKGEKAQDVVTSLLKRGDFPITFSPKIITDLDLQRRGKDIVVKGTWSIEVKCDWTAGGTSPNLFIQYAERNPLKQH